MDERFQKALVLLGLALVSCPNGVSMYFGNLLPYVQSYQYSVIGPRPGDLDLSWILGLFTISFALGTLVEAVLHRRIGLRSTMAVGMAVMACGLFLTYFTVQRTVWTIAITFCLVNGIGNGITTAACLQHVAGWFHRYLGIASSSTGASSGIGGILINQVTTAYINPDNLSPNTVADNMAYFSQREVLDRVPVAFLVIGAVTLGFHSLGLCLLCFLERDNRDEGFSVSSSNGLSTLNNKGHYGSKDALSNSDHDYTVCQKSKSKEVAKDQQVLIQRETNDLQPREVLKSEKFYIVFISIFAFGFGHLVCTTNYKIFGQLWIADDQFLAWLGSSLSLLGIFFRFVCGYLVDAFGTKNAILAHLTASSIFQAFWYFTALSSRWWFFIWTNVIFSVHNNIYALCPIITVKLFGREHCSANLFLVNLGVILAMLVSPPLMNLVLLQLGWFWLFFLVGCLAFTSLLVTIVRM